jgi:ADP-ribose pyrophosphatase YjhB (NUDIX family)
MTDRTLVELRCSAIVFRDDRLLLLRRRRDGAEDWVLPGGHPRRREGAAACVECEVLEETGIRIHAPRVAFLLETIDPAGDRRLIEVVFLAEERDGRSQPQATEPGTEAAFVPVEDTAGIGPAPSAGRLPSRPAPHRPAVDGAIPGQPVARHRSRWNRGADGCTRLSQPVGPPAAPRDRRHDGVG